MGHCIASFFQNWQEVAAEDRSIMLLWHIIYSFHMPLFAFCSGMLMAKKSYHTLKDALKTLWKRTKALLIPYVVVGCGIWTILNGHLSESYWFLPVLFECVFISVIVGVICSFFPKWNEHLESIILILLAILNIYTYKWLGQFDVFPIIDFTRLHHLFPYYVLGIVASRYRLVDKIISKNWCYAIALIVLIVLTYYKTINGIVLPFGKLTNRLIPVSAIIVCTYLCVRSNYSTCSSMLLQNVGRHSLEIYILSAFFPIRVWIIGDLSRQLCMQGTYGSITTTFVLQLVSSMILTVLIISLCYGVTFIIGKNEILSQLLLGRKQSSL